MAQGQGYILDALRAAALDPADSDDVMIGYPLGASGARIAGRPAHELRACGGYGLAAIGIGVGQRSAVVLHA
jgi:hypothetical protein